MLMLALQNLSFQILGWEILGLEISGDHARFLVPLLGGIIATGGFLAGRWSQHLRARRFRTEDLVATSVLIEFYGVTPGPRGEDVLHIITQGGSSTIDSFFRSPDLVHHVQREAVKHPGLMRLPSAVAHRMMMEEGKDKITGLDPKANVDFLHGRPTREDSTLCAFAAYPEKSHGATGLRDQVARLVLMVASPVLIAKLADPEYAQGLAVAHTGYKPRCTRLHDLAVEWQRLQGLPDAGCRSTGHDTIWQVTIRTAQD